MKKAMPLISAPLIYFFLSGLFIVAIEPDYFDHKQIFFIIAVPIAIGSVLCVFMGIYAAALIFGRISRKLPKTALTIFSSVVFTAVFIFVFSLIYTPPLPDLPKKGGVENRLVQDIKTAAAIINDSGETVSEISFAEAISHRVIYKYNKGSNLTRYYHTLRTENGTEIPVAKPESGIYEITYSAATGLPVKIEKYDCNCGENVVSAEKGAIISEFQRVTTVFKLEKLDRPFENMVVYIYSGDDKYIRNVYARREITQEDAGEAIWWGFLESRYRYAAQIYAVFERESSVEPLEIPISNMIIVENE